MRTQNSGERDRFRDFTIVVLRQELDDLVEHRSEPTGLATIQARGCLVHEETVARTRAMLPGSLETLSQCSYTLTPELLTRKWINE